MWYRSLIASLARFSRRRSPALRHRARFVANRRRLLVEGLEGRSLMVFNFLAQYATGAAPSDVKLADVNGDVRPDMIVANSGGDSIEIRLSNGNGTFDAAQNFTSGTSPNALAIGDFNGDSIPDVATANSLDVSLLLGNGDGTFDLPQTISLPPQRDPIVSHAYLAQYPKFHCDG